MIAILKKEIHTFFASPIGYLVIGVFLILNGLFLFLFKGEFNLLDNGVASLSSFFQLAPWVFIFLVPAISMRSFSDEMKQGTLELLLTKPILPLGIVMGKFLGVFFLVLLALVPSLLYVFTIYTLGTPQGNIDLGVTFGSYFGLCFLIMAYTSIGVFASSLTNNQIVAFLLSVFVCFFMYFGFEGIATVPTLNELVNWERFGIAAHFKSMGRGVIDTRDLVYFVSVSGFFIALTTRKINTH
jgi:ABC-2 type transport system permease protein